MVRQLVAHKGRLVEVPYTASVGDTLHALQTHNILAVPVAAPPGHWIGAGGSVILESDKATGAARKHYIGIISTLDIFIHLTEAGSGSEEFVTSLMASPVSKVIGHSLEGLTLWCLAPQTSVLDALEPMGKGLHRALVPLESQLEHHHGKVGLESIEASPGYRMLTQTDLVRFLQTEADRLRPIMSKSVASLGVFQSTIFGVPENMSLSDTMRCMTQASLAAVAIFPVSTSSDGSDDKQLVSVNIQRSILISMPFLFE